MNYLSHYYADYPEDRPYYVLGLILPDLVREIQTRKVRFMPEHLQACDGDNPIFQDLTKGILRHLDVDVRFHDSEFFHESVRVIRDWLLRFSYKSIPNRIPVFAHVLFELMIDRELIARQSEVIDQFYDLLEQVEKQPLIEYFQANGYIDEPEDVFHRVRFFCEDRFLYRYPDNDMMLYALNVLNQKVGNPLIETEDENLLIDTIELTENMLRQHKLNIFDQLRHEKRA